jgi:hypothetical protein
MAKSKDERTFTAIGLNASRLASNRCNPREVAFVKQWQQEQEHFDLLVEILQVPCSKDDPFVEPMSIRTTCGPHKCPLGPPTERDRIVAETVIQWLGSNCGLSFLFEALKRVGYTVKWPETPED